MTKLTECYFVEKCLSSGVVSFKGLIMAHDEKALVKTCLLRVALSNKDLHIIKFTSTSTIKTINF